VLLGVVFLLAVMTALFQVFVIAALGLSLAVFWAAPRVGSQQTAPRATAARLHAGPRDLLYFAITVLAPAVFALSWYFSGSLRHDTGSAFTFLPIPYAELTTSPLFGSYDAMLRPWPLYRELSGRIIFPLLVGAGIAAAILRRQIATAAPILVVVVAGAGIVAVDAASSYFWSYRQFLLIVPFYLCLAAYGVWSLVQLAAAKPPLQVLAAACLLAMLLWLAVPQLRAYYNHPKTNWRATAAILAAAAAEPANHIAIDPVWQPYVFYYSPALAERVVDLAAMPIGAGAAGPMRIWHLGAREALAAIAPATWEIETLAAEPALPIYIASNRPAAEWLGDFARASAPPTAYLNGLLYRLAWIDWDLMLQTGDRLLAAIRDGSAGLNARERADLTTMFARIKLDAGETDLGVNLMYEGVRHDDMSQEALNALGNALIHTGRLRQATAVLQHSLWHHPRSFWAYAMLADIYFAQRDWQRAARMHVKAWEYAYDPALKAGQAAGADAAFAALGDEAARSEFRRRVEQADAVAP
jgi:hypothetical protein